MKKKTPPKKAAKKKEQMLPAIPPDDYSGTQADWMVALQTRGLWNGQGFHGDIMIPESTYVEILEECEKCA